ncbi:MAG: ATP-dependent Clp protease ATP-binding subunit [Clostridiales bacterium]|nr:ATP-dependent Clp protease ATP-binding subunit [Clostridiales bacterium]
MLCSRCKKNTAVIFINTTDAQGNQSQTGYCYNCAKELGLNPLQSMDSSKLSDEEIKNLSNQLNKAFKDVIEKMSNQEITPEVLEEMQEQLNNSDDDNSDETSNKSFGMGFALPFNSLESFFQNNNSNESEEESSSSDKTQKTKINNKQNKKRKALNTYGTNLTEKARNHQIDKVIGREKEIERMIQILNRRTKNNPCLIGEPGVGKTALAQGLALRIANGDIPAKLMNKEVYLLDMTATIAGTQFRGQFEARMKQIIDECKSEKNIILVIDEIHNIVGAGDAEHSMNAANILKPSLADGTIQLIGTTTLNEYRKYIEKDSALERRFQPIIVEEPTASDTIDILKGIKSYYETYHKVTIPDHVITNLVKMAERYIHDRFFPDKAIDILDEACSKINLNNKDLYNLELLKNKFNEVLAEKEEAAEADSTEDYKKAAELKMKECQLKDEITKLEAKLKPQILTDEDIAKVIESWTKIPVQKITEEETEKLLTLESNLHKHVIGQDEAVEAVSRAIRRNRAGLKSVKRPPSFIFVGPTGVGKTELAKSLALEIFGKSDAIIRIDMSEYMESNSTTKLIGSPPGYVGYDDAGQLTEKVKRHPYSIILFDEIEKAHHDVFNLLLQVLDDGRLTDSKGNTISFENTIIIMTSNVGSTSNVNSIGFGSSTELKKNKILESMKEVFRPEFLNRIDEIICFNALTENELNQIITLMINDTQKILNDRNIKITISESGKKYLIEKGTDIKYGARPLRRAVQRYLEDELSDMILKKELLDGQTVDIDCKNDKLIFKVK